MLEIVVNHDTNLQPLEIQALMEGLRDFLRVFPRRKVRYLGSAAVKDEIYLSADSFLRSTQRFPRPSHGRRQYDGDSIIATMEREASLSREQPLQIFVTSEDLLPAAHRINGHRYSMRVSSGRNAVISVARLRRLSDEERISTIKTLLWQELGRMLGAAQYLRIRTEQGHEPCCLNQCTMMRATDVSGYLEVANSIKERGRIYCPDCEHDIKMSPI